MARLASSSRVPVEVSDVSLAGVSSFAPVAAASLATSAPLWAAALATTVVVGAPAVAVATAALVSSSLSSLGGIAIAPVIVVVAAVSASSISLVVPGVAPTPAAAAMVRGSNSRDGGANGVARKDEHALATALPMAPVAGTAAAGPVDGCGGGTETLIRCTASLVTVRMRCRCLWRDAWCITMKEREGRDASLLAAIATASCDRSVSAATAADCHRPRTAVPGDTSTVRSRATRDSKNRKTTTAKKRTKKRTKKEPNGAA